MDIILEGGTVVDGTGTPGKRADVGIEGESIAAVGDLSQAAAAKRIDVSGCVVAPGFIDVHTHHNSEMDGGIENIPWADNYLRQGVTTVVGGNCGGCKFPIGEHLERVSKLEIRQNYSVLVGCNTARSAVMREERPATPQELKRMCDKVREGFDDGAIGLSSGLTYLPFLTTEEVGAMAKVAADYDSFYVSHIRDEGRGLLDSIRETIEIGRMGGVPAQVSHIKCYGRPAWGTSEKALALIEEARAAGDDVSADQYPYTGCFTGLAGTMFNVAAVMRANRAGGLRKLLVPPLRAEAQRNFEQKVDYLGGLENVIMAPLKPDPEIQGKTLAEVLADRGGDPFERTVELCAGAHISAIYLVMCEEDVQTYMRSDKVMVGSDGHLRVFNKGFSHPRNFGTFPRVLARYVREKKVISLEEAVRKMTSFPARRIGLKKRGILRRGMIADITVFNPDTILDTATFQEGNSYPEGIEYVLLAGNLAVEKGVPAPKGYGRVIRRNEG